MRQRNFVFEGLFLAILVAAPRLTLAESVEARLEGLEIKVTRLEARLRKLEAPKAVALAPAGATESEDYNRALNFLKESRYKEARQAFDYFCKTYPQSASLPAASYWLAVSFFAEAQYDKAATRFQAFIEKWPKGEKVMDARLKLILCHQRLDDLVSARAALASFREALDQYSFSDPMARDVLRQRADALERTFEDETLNEGNTVIPAKAGKDEVKEPEDAGEPDAEALVEADATPADGTPSAQTTASA